MNPSGWSRRLGWRSLAACLAICGSLPSRSARACERYYRVVSPTDTVITAFSPDGILTWSNAAVGVTGRLQRATAMRDPVVWTDCAGYTVTDTYMTVPTADYLVVDLSAGPTAGTYKVSYLTCIPPEGWTDEYKTSRLVLRRVPEGRFLMGSPPGEPGRAGDETQHPVTLTHAFYMGVFEVTQKQWERVMGDWPAFFHNPAHRESRPVENISYDAIRGPGWPAPGGILDGDTFMGRLRARTGRAFDLPTEAQWEYAGRAGVGTSLHSGFNVTNLEAEADARASELGRYAYNGGSHYEWNVDTNGATAAVGSYRPNAWGLYDFHGNVWEWCRDWYGAYPTSAVDPAGAPTGAYRVRRGGSWANSAGDCRLAFREGLDASAFSPRVGFRVATPQEP